MHKHNHAHPESQPHQHAHGHTHGHTHGVVDPSLITTQRGVWAIKWSFVALATTALLQVVVVVLSGSVALLADTIHNFGDAATAIPLWIAFSLARRKPNKRFTYGYGRVEDLAGVVIVAIILFSALMAGYASINRLFYAPTVEHLWAVIAASVIGFLGNEAVAIFRIRVGKEIGSAALIADGYHARVDGLTSLAVLFGAVGVWLGYPLADPIVGLLISVAILRIVWESGSAVFTRLLDGVDPEVIDKIRHVVIHTPGVLDMTEARVRWLGHRLHVEANITVNSELPVGGGHEIAMEVRHRLWHSLRYLSSTTIHVDPTNASGEEYHPHGGLLAHSQ
jgi:cation diffusion facilitator family transporter